MIPAPVPVVASEKVSTTSSATVQTDLELAAIATAPSCARGHVRAVAYEWGLPGLADTAELVMSELVTNAVQASDRLRFRAGPPIVPVVKIWLVSDRISLVIHVWDGSEEMPVREDGAPDHESGRGLMLVENLAKDWGAYRKAAGKVVWALISPDQPPEAGGPMSLAAPDRLPVTMR